MTRLTNDLRNTIRYNIMKGLPNRDYRAELFTVIQDAVVKFMDPKVRAVYDYPNLRPHLRYNESVISHGSKYLRPVSGDDRYIIGLTKQLEIRTADAELPGRVNNGSLYHHLLFKTNLAALTKAYFEQEELRKQVEKRLTANLAAATTIKRLYDVLEPELHGYIPRETAKEMLLPTTVAPVVDDLRKLGANLPETPKAAQPA